MFTEVLKYAQEDIVKIAAGFELWIIQKHNILDGSHDVAPSKTRLTINRLHILLVGR